MRFSLHTIVSVCLVLTLCFGLDANSAENAQLLSIDRIFHDKEFELNKKVPSKWLQGGDSYTTVESSASLADGFDIVQHESASGQRTVIVAAELLVPEGADKPLEIKDYAWSDDGRFLLINTNTVKFRRYEPLGDYWLLTLSNSELRQIAPNVTPSSLMYAKFSPDSANVAYMFENNLFIESVDGQLKKQLTHDGSDLIVNGTGDWVNEEEFSLRDGFKWSPDSRRLIHIEIKFHFALNAWSAYFTIKIAPHYVS